MTLPGVTIIRPELYCNGRALPEGHSHPETPNRILQPTPSLNITQSIKSQQMIHIFIYCRPLGKKNCWLFLSPKNHTKHRHSSSLKTGPVWPQWDDTQCLVPTQGRGRRRHRSICPETHGPLGEVFKVHGIFVKLQVRQWPELSMPWREVGKKHKKRFFTQPNYRLFGTEKGPNSITGPKKWVPKRLHQNIVRCRVFG